MQDGALSQLCSPPSLLSDQYHLCICFHRVEAVSGQSLLWWTNQHGQETCETENMKTTEGQTQRGGKLKDGKAREGEVEIKKEWTWRPSSITACLCLGRRSSWEALWHENEGVCVVEGVVWVNETYVCENVASLYTRHVKSGPTRVWVQFGDLLWVYCVSK